MNSAARQAEGASALTPAETRRSRRKEQAPAQSALRSPAVALLRDDTVYQRTLAGQREAVAERIELSPNARRFLLIVNGETPLRVLLDLLRLEDESVISTILHLVELGLIEQHAPRPGGPVQTNRSSKGAP